MIEQSIAMRIYQVATAAKQLDDKVQSLLMSGKIHTTWFSWRGSELLGAAIGLSLEPDDYMVAYYRDGMSQMAKGFPPELLFAEAIGKATGSQRGKSGWVHSVYPDANVVMNSGVVGGQLPIAAGWALSSVLRQDGRVTLCNFGDGAANEGAFHEAMTLASLWRLPVVYVCHNNWYAEHTAFASTSPVPSVADRASAYAIPAVTVDGNDVDATWGALSEAIDRARQGEGPSLVEATTYRFRGHTRYDGMKYVPDGEVAAHVAADPVVRFRADLIAVGHASEAELAALDEEGARAAEAAWEFARESPYPEVEELLTDVYAGA